MGRAGLGLVSFLFVVALAILAFGRPAVGSAPFIMTILTLVVAVTTGAALLWAMRRTLRTTVVPETKESHNE